MIATVFYLIAATSLGSGAEPEVGCPAPRSPDGGQAFLHQGGLVVKFVCDPGFELVGAERVTCLGGEWEEPFPICARKGEDLPKLVTPPPAQEGTTRPLFAWGEDNSTAADEAYPRRKEEERSGGPPSVIYVRRNDDRRGDRVLLLPRQAVAAQNDKGDQYLRQLYYHNNYYYQQQHYPYYQRRPVLSDSQMAWINSLHPELRDQYLRAMHVDDYRNYYYDHLYLRQPVAARLSTTSALDYSCNRAGAPFVAAPRLPHASVARYDRRQNPAGNPFLAAVYRCAPGHAPARPDRMELYCSGRRWVGSPRPLCLPLPPST